MVGKPDMNLHGWRQLIEWSIEHSCMGPDEIKTVKAEWLELWRVFCRDVITKYSSVLEAQEKEKAEEN